ncbi:MAG TPA: hypothetical protein VIL16_22320 [Trebonia sp.]
MSDEDMQSALLVLVPAAEPVVGPHRARLDSSARDGVPAHLTVLYPFLPPAEIGQGVLAKLSRLFAAVRGCSRRFRGSPSAWTGSARSISRWSGWGRQTSRRSGR